MSLKMLFGYNFGKLSLAVIPATQKTAKKEDWQDVDPATLSEELQVLHAEYKDAYAALKATPERKAVDDTRKAFEAAMRETAGIVAAPKAAAKGSVSLADFIASRVASGAQV